MLIGPVRMFFKAKNHSDFWDCELFVVYNISSLIRLLTNKLLWLKQQLPKHSLLLQAYNITRLVYTPICFEDFTNRRSFEITLLNTFSCWSCFWCVVHTVLLLLSLCGKQSDHFNIVSCFPGFFMLHLAQKKKKKKSRNTSKE